MLFDAHLVHAESGRRVVRVSARRGEERLGSALGEGETAEEAEDRALQRLLQRLRGAGGNDGMAPPLPALRRSPPPVSRPPAARPDQRQEAGSDQLPALRRSTAAASLPPLERPDQRPDGPAATAAAIPAAESTQLALAPATIPPVGGALPPPPAVAPGGPPAAASGAAIPAVVWAEPSAPWPEMPETDTPGLAPAPQPGPLTEDAAGGAAAAEPDPQEEPPADPEDWSSELAALDLQLRRLGWDRQQEGIYLQRAFSHPSRSRLTRYSDLQGYLAALEGLEPGADPALAPVPLRRADLLVQGDALLSRLGWSPDQGRAFLERHLQRISRRQLSDAQLLAFNMLLEGELLAGGGDPAGGGGADPPLDGAAGGV